MPAYYQIAEDLGGQIESGRLQPGDPIPSESQLCELHGISRMTVRQGLNLLIDAGYIRSCPGKGSFVAEPCLNRLAIEFEEGLVADGTHLDPREVACAVVAVDTGVADRLGVSEGAQALEFRRLSFRGDEPVSYESKFFAPPVRAEDVPPMDEARYLAFPALAAHAAAQPFVKVRVEVYAGEAPEQAAAGLSLDGSPTVCLILEQTVLARDGHVVGWGCSYFAPGRYRVVAESDPFWRRVF